jgi:peroxiredoxin
MIIRRANWSILIGVAILGPLFGMYVGASLPLDLCSSDDELERQQAEAPAATTDDDQQHDRPAQPVALPDGDQVTLDELAPGRPVALVVMKGTWCPVCQKQLKRLSNRMPDIQAADAAVFGLSTSEAKTNRQLQNRLELGFPILGDADKSLHRGLEMWVDRRGHAMPGVIYLDEEGRIAKVHRGRYPGQNQTDCILDTLDRISDDPR